MIAAYSFNTTYHQTEKLSADLPSLRLLEGGKFTAGQFSPVLVKEYGQVRLKFYKWGLIPAWMKAHKLHKGYTLAPADHVFQHTAYQIPIRRNRCLIPADGYYECLDNKLSTQQFKVMFDEGQTFCFAGIYDQWKALNGSLQHSFAIITTQASAPLDKFGLQAPLVLNKKQERIWLNPNSSMDDIQRCMFNKSMTPKAVAIHPVQELVAA